MFKVLIMNLFNLLLIQAAETDVCTSAPCRKASTDILSFIEPSVDPCHDFYKFTCGGVFKKTYDAKPASLEAIVGREVEEQTTQMLLKPIEYHEPKVIRALKKFFRSCLDEVSIESDSLITLKRIIKELGGWPIVDGNSWKEGEFSMEELLIKLRRMGYEYMQFFYFGTSVGGEEQILLVTEPFIQNIELKDKEIYFDYMSGVAALLGADQKTAFDELQETLTFKMNLLRILENAGEFNTSTIRTVQDHFPIFNWTHYINSIVHPNKEHTQDEIIYLPSPEYLSGLSDLLRQTSNRILSNYIIWEMVEAVIPYLPHEFKDLRDHYERLVSNKDANKVPKLSRLDFCKNEAKVILPPIFGVLYIREHFSLERKRSVQELISLIHTELLNILNATELYDEETREKMLEKAKAITYHFGAPVKMFDEALLKEIFDENENIEIDNILAIASLLNRQRNNFNLNLEIRLNRRDNYYEETVIPHGFYETFKNAFVLPAAMLQGLYYNEKRPQYMNFGTLGTMAAVELIKGFTQEGSKYDKFGHLARLWTNAARRNFNQNTDCLMREASLFDIENTDIKMNGKLTRELNAYDYTGVEIAYRAYNRWTNIYGSEHKLPGMSYTPKQLFWISAASFFCETVSLDHLRQYVEEEKLVYPPFRTYGALSNNHYFGKDFKCQFGSRMNPSKKCQVF